MRDFAFIDCSTLEEAQKIVDYSKKYGVKLMGQEIYISYSKLKKPMQMTEPIYL